MRNRAALVVMLLAFVAGSAVLVAGVKIRTTRAKDFAFINATTYAWHPGGAGDVKLLVIGAGTAEDYKRRLEPTIVQAVDENLQRRGLKKTAADQAALYVNYYALLGQGTSAQEVGQFVPAVPEWGLPPLPPSTTALTTYPMGSLVLDVSSTSLKAVVWRAVAEAEIDRLQNDTQRQKRLSEAIRDMLKKYPN